MLISERGVSPSPGMEVETPGHRLSDRAAWRVLCKACRSQSLAEAVQEATSILLGGVPVHLNHHAANPDAFMADQYDMLSFAVGPVEGGRYALTLVDTDAAAGWHAGRTRGPEGWTGRVDRRLRRHRMWLLTRALRRYRYSKGSTTEALVSPDLPAHLVTVHAALLHWWDDRMAEGHPVESVRTMLGLLARPETLALVEWTPDGRPLPRDR